ncbi:MAG: GNAT family protein [Actinomycetota bacterium]
MLVDGDLTLRPVTEEDLPARYAWTVDAQTHLIADSRPLLPITWERYLERSAGRPSSPDNELYTIEVDGRRVGHCQLTLFDHLARSAMVGITLAPGERGRHVGRRSVRLLVDHGFRDRGLHRVWLGTSSDNIAGQRADRAVGFVQETLEREQSWVDGRYVDEMRMSILRHEWDAVQTRASADADG